MTKEEAQGLLMMVAILGLFVGFKLGYKTGKRDLLLGLEGALRTIHTKEQ